MIKIKESNCFNFEDGLHLEEYKNEYFITCCVDLFNDVFKTSLSFAQFYNKHFVNPYAIKTPICFYASNDKIVGMNAFMGMLLKINNSVITVVQSCDTAVSSSQRGKGIFTKMVSWFEENKRETQFIIGIPNNNSKKGFLKIGYEQKALLTTMTKLRVRLLRRTKPSKNIRIYENISFTSDELALINNSFELGFLRSNEYINYKLINIDNARIVSAYVNNALVGYLIAHISGTKMGIKIVTIDDWYFKEETNYKSTLQKMLNTYISGLYIIKIPMININSKDYEMFKRCGFVDYKKALCKDKQYESFIVSKHGSLYDVDWNKLRISYLDSDTILNG